MATTKRHFRAGRVTVVSSDNALGKNIYVVDQDDYGEQLLVATTAGGIDALIDALQDAKRELFHK